MLENLKKDLEKLGSPGKAQVLQKFFKTGRGEYGEGDIFLGVTVPEQRQIAKKYGLNLEEIQNLLNSEIHEHRLVGLLILMNKENNQEIFDFYLANTKNINNWDLVDLSAHKIVGDFLLEKDKQVIYNLAKSKDLWEKRIAIVSTFAFIRKNEFGNTLEIARILLNDEHDLIHKAVGWMLREIGKRNVNILENFLREHYQNMPRTMLRYAIEKFDEEKRQKYLRGKI